MVERILLAAEEGPVNFQQLNRSIWGYQASNSPGLLGGVVNFFRALGADYSVSGFETPGAIITTALPVLISLGGLILFVMLVWGGVEIMLGAASTKSVESGKKRITTAVIGFLLLFASYWIGQLIQFIFGINIGLR